MKYLQTFRNLEKIMDNASELIKHKTYYIGCEDYIYKDDNIYFNIFITEYDKLSVHIHKDFKVGSLYYYWVDGEWELDTLFSDQQQVMPELNKVIKDIVIQIEEDKYTPVAQEGENE